LWENGWPTKLYKDERANVLYGTTIDVYRLVLKIGKPLGIREVQRLLELSSPSVAQYHLTKLERAGLIRKVGGNYVCNKLFLENYIRISHTLLPKYLFYTVFALSVLFTELLFLRPIYVNREYLFLVLITIVFSMIFCYETAKVWIRHNI
jgi:hypothetical protein